MILKFLLVVALLATVQAAPECKCGSTTHVFNAITNTINKARVYERRAEKPEYPRQFSNPKGYSFSHLCAGVAAEQLYEFPIRASGKPYNPTSSNRRKQTPGVDRVIYNHSNGEFCGCVRLARGSQLCEIVDSTTGSASAGSGSKKKHKKKEAGSSHDSAVGSTTGPDTSLHL